MIEIPNRDRIRCNCFTHCSKAFNFRLTKIETIDRCIVMNFCVCTAKLSSVSGYLRKIFRKHAERRRDGQKCFSMLLQRERSLIPHTCSHGESIESRRREDSLRNVNLQEEKDAHILRDTLRRIKLNSGKTPWRGRYLLVKNKVTYLWIFSNTSSDVHVSAHLSSLGPFCTGYISAPTISPWIAPVTWTRSFMQLYAHCPVIFMSWFALCMFAEANGNGATSYTRLLY